MDIDLVKPTPKNNHPLRPPHQTDPPSHTTKSPPLALPKICTSKVACIYDVMGKCKGMLTSQRFNILYKAFHDTNPAGIHDTIMPPPKSFVSELLGLLSCSTLHDNRTPMYAKVKHSCMRALPLRFHSVLPKNGIIQSDLMDGSWLMDYPTVNLCVSNWAFYSMHIHTELLFISFDYDGRLVLAPDYTSLKSCQRGSLRAQTTPKKSHAFRSTLQFHV